VDDAWVIGAGMTRFAKSDLSLREIAASAARDACEDANLEPGSLEAAYVGNGAAGLVTGQEMIRGQVMLSGFGAAGIPIFNVENACASASTALHLGWQAVASGVHDVVLCLGAEKLTHEDKTVGMRAISAAADVEVLAEIEAMRSPEEAEAAGRRSYFMDVYAEMTRSYMARSGAQPEDFAAVAVKNQRHGALNPRAQYGGEFTVEQIMNSRMVVDPLRLLMCSPISDGAAAVILASDAAKRRLGRAGARLRASVLLSGNPHDPGDPTSGSTGRAAARAYELAGLGPDDLDCAEVHDASAPAELMVYEQIGLASAGAGAELLASGRTRLGGDIPVNTSGGLLSKGHPIGATGLAQVCEATWQLRGQAGDRQVAGARVALTQNGGGWINGDTAAIAIHILSSD
jgi:acetyl-CoA acetyltransferase